MQVKKLNPSLSKDKTKSPGGSFVKLRMERIAFKDDTMLIFLHGGRILSIPLYKYPGIKKLTRQQRVHYHIAGGISLDFESSDEVYHIEELLGIR